MAIDVISLLVCELILITMHELLYTIVCHSIVYICLSNPFGLVLTSNFDGDLTDMCICILANKPVNSQTYDSQIMSR